MEGASYTMLQTKEIVVPEKPKKDLWGGVISEKQAPMSGSPFDKGSMDGKKQA